MPGPDTRRFLIRHHAAVAAVLVLAGGVVAGRLTAGRTAQTGTVLLINGREDAATAYKVGLLPTAYFVKADGTIEGSYLGQLDEATLLSHLSGLGLG